MSFDLEETYVHLEDGEAAIPLEVGADFWQTLPGRSDLGPGRLLCSFRFEESWKTWEMHPAGDEVVMLLSGAIDLLLDEEGGVRSVALRDRGVCIVPSGVWHTATVHRPSEVLHITRGAGTRTRPV